MVRDEEITVQLQTVRDYLRWAVSRMTLEQVYFGHGTDNALDEALALVLPLVGIPAGTEAPFLDARLTHGERELLLDAIDRRVRERVPVAYITGEAWFAQLPFEVDERVLIPRSPLAELIENGFEPWIQAPVRRVLDLCTGSGCIGIACAVYLEGAQVDLADISDSALAVARANVDLHELEEEVRVLRSDLFSALTGEQYDLILSNPPYVDREDFEAMPEEYRHEPAMALQAGSDGLDIVRRLLREAPDYLTPGGVLFVEVGNSWEALEAAFPEVPFTWVEFERGGHGVFVITRSELEQYDFSESDGRD